MATFNFKSPYKTLLIVFGLIIVAIFTLIFLQIFELKTSGERVISNLNQTQYINELLLNLVKVEEKIESNTLRYSYLDSIERQNHLHIRELDMENPELRAILDNHDFLYDQLKKNITGEITLNKQELLNLIKVGRKFKTEFLQRTISSLKTTSQFSSTENNWYPRLFMFLAGFGFIMSGLILYQFLNDRKVINEKSGILDAILANTNDVANFYEPVLNDDNVLIDFKITYASKTNVSLTAIPNNELIGSHVSKVYPFLVPSGLFEQLKFAYLNQSYFEKDLEVPIQGKNRYFKARYIPVKTGLQVMVTEFTNLLKKQEQLEEINEKLLISNTIFHEAEVAANLGSYVWFMREDRTVMSDNVYRMLGFEPQSFEMSAAKYREFTHPDDIDAYDKVVENALEKGIPIEFVFRIITNDKKIKHIFTKGNFSERDGETIMIGVIQDISDRVLNENRLKSQNIELTRRNIELDSFTRVASHDLQEPLRKIQMFISRILELERDVLSDKGKVYVDKINDNAARMRKLIDNLLALSRIDNAEYGFETTDLNELLDDVLDTYSDAIISNNIVVVRDNLPKLHAVPFLMEQLFSNLLNNAIKYRDQNRDAKIVFDYSRINKNQIPHSFTKAHNYYHSIKLIDNGIGFSQSNADKIFEVFQRLHANENFKGSGIGLAICKQIVLKHQGFIHANSVKNKGSIFTIYLPEGNIKA